MSQQNTGFQSFSDLFNEKFMKKDYYADDQVVTDFLDKKVAKILLNSDVSPKIVKEFLKQIKENLKAKVSDSSKHKTENLKQEVIKGLANLLTPKPEYDPNGSGALVANVEWIPTRGKSNIVMFVGMNGAGKTTSIVKYAHYWKKKGLKPLCICADTFRPGAYDQLMQNCQNAGIHYFGSYTENRPEVIVQRALKVAESEKFDLILVDTAGRNKNDTHNKMDLKLELEEIVYVAKPDHTILVLDAHTGQTVADQALFFKEISNVKSIILSKMDGSAKGGGALAAVAATKCQVAWIGTGELVKDFEAFDSQSYISRLLGFGDMKRLFEVIQETEVKSSQKSENFIKKMLSRDAKFTFNDFRGQIEMISSLAEGAGSYDNLVALVPGLKQMFNSKHSKQADKSGKSSKSGKDEEIQVLQTKMKRFLIIIDSMSTSEREMGDSVFTNQPSRVLRISRGSGTSKQDIEEMVSLFRPMKGAMDTMKSLPKMSQKILSSSKFQDNNMNAQDLGNPMDILKSIMGNNMGKRGGMDAKLNGLLKQFGGALKF